MLRFTLLSFINLGVVSTQDLSSYKGSQVLRVDSFPKDLMRPYVKSGDVEVWNSVGNHKEIFVSARSLNDVFDILNKKQIKTTVLTNDLQKVINKEQKHTFFAGMRLLGEGKTFSWDAYHRLDDIYQFIDGLARDHPKRIQVVNIGKSVLGKHLKVVVIKSGNKEAKKMWIDGGIHAREWVAPAVVTYIMNELAKLNDTKNSPLGKIDFYICPLVNPDGYEHSHTTDRLWRKNMRTTKLGEKICKGVDLNRNFNAYWKPSKHCNRVRPFHSYSQVVLYPYGFEGGNVSEIVQSPHYHSMVKLGDSIANHMSRIDNHTYRSLKIYDYTKGAYGSSVDWAMHMGIRYPYAIELRPDSSDDEPGFFLPPNQIIPSAKEAMAAVNTIASFIIKDGEGSRSRSK